MGSCANAKDEQFVHLQSRWQTSMLYYKLGGISGEGARAQSII